MVTWFIKMVQCGGRTHSAKRPYVETSISSMSHGEVLGIKSGHSLHLWRRNVNFCDIGIISVALIADRMAINISKEILIRERNWLFYLEIIISFFGLLIKNLQKMCLTFAMSVCLLITAQKNTDFHEIWYCGVSLKCVDMSQCLLKSDTQVKTSESWAQLAKYLLEWKTLLTKVVEKNETHILFPLHCFCKSFSFQNNHAQMSKHHRIITLCLYFLANSAVQWMSDSKFPATVSLRIS
jgi:hypothetical protein